MDFFKKIDIEESENICIDFDNVIHDNSAGFGNGEIIGKMIEGSDLALKYFVDSGYKIIIYTAKAKPDRPLINGKDGINLVWNWLKKNNIDKYISDITSEKPRGVCYIDDKAIRFNNWNQALNEFKNYYKK